MTYERLYHGDKLSRDLLDGRAADGLRCSYEDYRAAERTIQDYRRRFAAAMDGVDLLLTPSAPGEAPEGIGRTGDAIFNNLWTTTHVPAVTLPAGKGPKGLPLGVQLVGRLHQDHRLLEAAKAVQCQVLDRM
jgi:Asp-tRNA(Asn)/Glu-tRNA(Gln) amidotransferase A subunit family amidase